jgi:asparagine synthase (glutamine-hydrolysing)
MRGPRRNLIKLLRGIDQPAIERYLTYCSYYRSDELTGVLSAELRAGLSRDDPFRRHRAYAGNVADEHWLNQLLYIDMKTFLPCLNLTYTDKMSMAASTEVRVPLLDDEVIKLAGRIPPQLKLNRTKRKYVLKHAMEDLLPHEIIWRPKAGFGAPVRSWLNRDLRPTVDELLSPASLRARGLLDPSAVRRLIEDDRRGTADNSLRIWALLVLELWHREFVDQPARSAAGVTV